MAGRIRKMFPGGNTPQGFFSFYDQMIHQEATKIFVLKGGPGTGKSTLMKKIGATMVENGFDCEYHCCSSDNDSLDGVVIPALQIAVLDGTAPHVVDPRNPGAVDEIVHLGDYWDEQGLQYAKEEILASNREISRLFQRAYDYLAAAKIFLEQVESYYQDTNALSTGFLDTVYLTLSQQLFSRRSPQTNAPSVRHLFATAITPQGYVSHLDTLVGHLGKRFIITGDEGTGKSTLIARLMESAVIHGFHVEAFHCAMDPQKVEHIIIPALDAAVITSVEPHFYQPRVGDTLIDTKEFVKPIVNEKYLQEKANVRNMYRQCLTVAVEFIAKAKAEHDHLESFYVPHMKFQEINQRGESILARIMEMACC